ncbi:XAC2610-related protein [Pedobacter endophyticus]|uniref:VCBS repeat-containing protein n=1 Tax=Pedobacter endophyticus TaxID=2789740 RepID=A0A7S9L2P6_9SPHI|nr:hypothetical protein [Pedobacter endophyticus]QPH41051.1 hypothetical protein IZT61_07270 [Pedobacter endophyticus]
MKALILFCLSLSALYSSAQYKFLANNCSNQYDVKVFVANCESRMCGGKATLILYDKITGKEIETFHSLDLDFNLTDKQNEKLGWIELGKYQSPLVFGDFNFDGYEDMAIRNGSNGAYSSPSFDVYLSAANQKFELNAELTKLASENLGMFDVDKKRKELVIHLKSGCCYQQSISYQFFSKNKLTEVSSVIEDSSIGDDVTVITRRLIDGKMQKKVEKFKIKDYYTDN